MIVHSSWPVSTVGNCDFVTKATVLEPGQRVLNTQISVDTLPNLGDTLCLHEETVKIMVDLLGYRVVPKEQESEVANLKAELALAQEELAKYRKAATAFIDTLEDQPS